MYRFVFIILLVLQTPAFCQKELKNIKSTWHETYGGMEESGISRTESFLFIAKKKITLNDINHEGKEIVLKKNDSIQINRYSHRPYSGITQKQEKENTEVPLEKRFRVFKKNNCFYISVQYPYEWNGIIQYTYKKKKLSAKIKDGFDDGKADYAP